jgi:hypothetical protein
MGDEETVTDGQLAELAREVALDALIRAGATTADMRTLLERHGYVAGNASSDEVEAIADRFAIALRVVRIEIGPGHPPRADLAAENVRLAQELAQAKREMEIFAASVGAGDYPADYDLDEED